jgi:Eukaryotic aspartyl protease
LLHADRLANGRGSILFGGIDTERFHPPLVALPIQPDMRTRTVMSFTVALDNFSVRDANKTLTYSRTGLSLPVILDSGTTITYLPDPIAEDIYVGVGAVETEEYGVVVPCSVQDVPATLSFGFGNAGGPVISAAIGQFVLPFPSKLPKVAFVATGDEACRWGLQAAEGRPLLFGDTFLRAAYVVYGIDGKHVAVANARFNVSSSSSHVVEIEGPNFPSAVVSSTATGNAAFTAPTGDASSGAYPPGAVTFGSGTPADITTRPSGTWNLGTPTATRAPKSSGRGKGGSGGREEGGKKSAAVRQEATLGVSAVAGIIVAVLGGMLFGGGAVAWRI